MVIASYVAEKVQENLQSSGYVVAVFPEKDKILSRNNSIIILEREAAHEVITPLSIFNSHKEAINGVIQEFFRSKEEDFKKSLDKEFIVSNLYPSVVKERPKDVIFNSWKDCYITYYYVEDNEKIMITSQLAKALELGPRDLKDYATNNLLQSLEFHNYSSFTRDEINAWRDSLPLKYCNVECDDVCFISSTSGDVTGVMELSNVFSVFAESKKADLLVIAINRNAIIVADIAILQEVFHKSDIKDLHQLGYKYLRYTSEFADSSSALAAPYKFSLKTSQLESL